MVSKVAVIAIVVIVAAPILLGYAMAFEEVDKDVWTEDRTRSVNGLFNNGVAWTWVSANTYTMNGIGSLNDGMDHYMTPYYNQIAASPYTSIEVGQRAYSANATITMGQSSGTVYIDDGEAATLHVTYLEGGVIVNTNQALTFSASFSGGSIYGFYQTPLGVNVSYQFDNVQSFSFNKDVHIQDYVSGSYADPAAGWTVNQLSYAAYAQLPIFWGFKDLITDMVVITVDFGPTLAGLSANDTVSSTIRPLINGMVSGGPLEVTMHKWNGLTTDSSYMEFNGQRVYTAQTIGMDFVSTDNVWQFVFDLDGAEAYYVKSWPDQFGRAQYYQQIEIPYEYASDSDPRVTEIYGLSLEEGLTYRIDYAHTRSTSYPIATDITWDATDLLQDDEASYRITFGSGQIGSSIGWAGQTYKITDGSIKVGSVKYKVSELQLDSRYLNGERINYINGRQISTGDNELQLGGSWTAIVSLSELTHSTNTVTEWQPGEFAWNGVDQSFALMGLITCAAAFVGLGMYGKRSGAKVGTLMLVCGCAAFVFLALL